MEQRRSRRCGPASALAALAACVLLLTPRIAAQAASGRKVLVLVQDEGIKASHSKFLGALEASGLELDVKAVRDQSIKLRDYDAWLYDHLAILAPKAENFGGGVDVSAILEFVDSGHNLLLAGSGQASDFVRTLAAEVGIDVDDRGTQVYDHFQHALGPDSKPDHTLIAAVDIVPSKAIFGGDIRGPLLFRGVAATVPADAELVTVAASAPVTSYSHDPRKAVAEPPALMAGPGIALLALVQARNNARIFFTGSLDLLSDALFDAEVKLGVTGASLGPSINRQVAVSAALWTFQQRGVLVVQGPRHALVGAPPGSPAPSGYRVTDDVDFAIDVWEVTAGKRTPYIADDIQVEFVMLDPYVRAPLSTTGNGTYSLRFKVPDVYGVFKYVVSYHHLGYSYIDLTLQVPVRPFKHNEYERFLVVAYPYYASGISSMLAFAALGFFFLYHKG